MCTADFDRDVYLMLFASETGAQFLILLSGLCSLYCKSDNFKLFV